MHSMIKGYRFRWYAHVTAICQTVLCRTCHKTLVATSPFLLGSRGTGSALPLCNVLPWSAMRGSAATAASLSEHCTTTSLFVNRDQSGSVALCIVHVLVCGHVAFKFVCFQRHGCYTTQPKALIEQKYNHSAASYWCHPILNCQLPATVWHHQAPEASGDGMLCMT